MRLHHPDPMPAAELHQYFDAEKQAGLLAIGLGVASVCFASYLWFTRSPLRAAGWPLVIIGLLELGVGAGLVLRTDAQVDALDRGFGSVPAQTAAAESQRMAKVKGSFRVILAAEVVLLIGGAFLVFVFRRTHPIWAAIGAGLVLQAAVLLVFDLFAEHRAHRYVR